MSQDLQADTRETRLADTNPSLTAPTERLPTLAEGVPDARIARLLPYAFARASGLIAVARRAGAIDLWVHPRVTALALAEARRTLGEPIRPQRIAAEQFERQLALAYSREGTQAASLFDDMSETIDLRSLADELPRSTDLLESEDDAPLIRFINVLLTQALRERASDIHIEVFEEASSVRFRIDGVLRDVLMPPRALHAAIVSRVEVMASLDIAERRLPQDGRITLRLAGRAVDVRVSTLPTGHGERVVLRLLDKQAGRLDFESLGMSARDRDRVGELISQPHGIILVTGPTGSGKTTTLYAALSRIDSARLNIMTVEDPIEYDLEGIGQTQVNAGIDMTFARALRAILRQDPDVVMIGEIRDLETARIAVQASLTGHLVLATLHTNDAIGAVTRLIDMGIEPFLLSSSLLGVMAQRLVRRLCTHCRTLDPPTAAERELLPPDWGTRLAGHAVGCEHCAHSGYRGRTGIYELLVIDEATRGLIHSGDSEPALRARAQAGDVAALRDDGLRWVADGETTLEEVLRVTRAVD